MKTIEIQVYKFNELSDKVKRKLIDQFSEHQDFSYLYDEFTNCLYEFLDLFNIDRKQIDYSIGAYQHSYINIKDLDNSIFNGMNTEFINSIDNELTGICYGMDFVQYLKEYFAKTGSVRLALDYALAKTLKVFQSELEAHYKESFIISELENLDLDYLINGTEVELKGYYDKQY